MLTEIAEKYGKSVAQVVLKWNAQRGVVIIPKSVNQNRIVENLNIWDFELDQEDMDKIATMDIGHSEIVNHSDPEFVRYLITRKIHE
jgi:diketogulonate reductase-like aldo/keto reductase